MGQTVNLLLNCFEGSNPSLPTSFAGFVRRSFSEDESFSEGELCPLPVFTLVERQKKDFF